MKRLTALKLIILLAIAFSGCEKDNLDGPNASFSGQLIDRKTGEPLAQEISEGSRLYFIETGWDNPPVQSMIVKSNGSFKNTMMFAGKYKFILNRGNFAPLDTLDIDLKKGENKMNFEVTPLLRVLEPEIVKNGRTVKATFKIEQVTSNNVRRITLFAHPHSDVSSQVNLVRTNIDVNGPVSSSDVFNLSIDLDANASVLQEGKSYYFRIGAQCMNNEAKYNYAEAVLIKL